jgi:putative OPT family oligopeptide transporter
MPWVAAASVAAVVPLFFLFRHLTGSPGTAACMAVVMLVAGFFFSAVASYMAGVVGSSNNPISGVTIATILFAALLLLALGTGRATGPAAAILIGAVVCCAAAMGGDTLQDLKTGQLVGATPWKQQVMEVISVLAAALVLAPVLTLLLDAYGIGPRTPERPNSLPAPQATLMASVAKGVFARDLPWAMIGIGMGLAAALILLDSCLEKRQSRFRTPVLAVAVGLYLPLELGVAILLGGLVAWAAERRHAPSAGGHSAAESRSLGVLLAAGLITGESMLGILLAIPIVANGGKNPLALSLPGGPRTWPGVLLLAIALWALYAAGTSKTRDP